MKKWADLKCDGKRRIVALRGPNGATIRKKNLGPVEKMVHEILMMSPQGGETFVHPGTTAGVSQFTSGVCGFPSDGENDPDPEGDVSKLHGKSSSLYLNLTDSSYCLGGVGALDISPLSSPDKDGELVQS